MAKQANYKDYVLTIEDDGKVIVTKNGAACDNTMAALREIASLLNFKAEDGWNTRQFGAKLYQEMAGAAGAQAKAAVEDKELEKRVEGSASELASAKVKVYGKAQNRTALGIMHAYHVMYPQATMQDFELAFPKALNTDSGWPVNFKTLEDVQNVAAENAGFWFAEEDEILNLQDGTKMCVVKMWTKPSFERLVTHAKQYDIVVADFEKGIKGEKGGFRLEYLNGYVPPVADKKGIPAWVWALIGILGVAVIALLLWLLLGKKPETQIVEKVVTETIVVHDTLYLQQIEEIEKNFNAAEFVAGKADLSDDAKFVLHDLAKVMQKNEGVRLRLEGHTSAEGDAAFNQKLSEARAQAAVDFLVEHEGVDASRLEAVGLGSSRLKNEADPMAAENRRTEFVVIE